jgi:hypothetical protein
MNSKQQECAHCGKSGKEKGENCIHCGGALSVFELHRESDDEEDWDGNCDAAIHGGWFLLDMGAFWDRDDLPSFKKNCFMHGCSCAGEAVDGSMYCEDHKCGKCADFVEYQKKLCEECKI